jgi:LysR family transcriptional regulator, glycine cleavage system transcriptional activator
MTSRSTFVRRLPPLNALRVFESAARHLSFGAAATQLNITQSAVSHQIKILEDFLGVRLFRRLPRSLELTDHGQRIAVPLRDAFEILYAETELIVSKHRPTKLHLNVLPTLAMRWLIPRLQSFTAANPNVELRMVTSIQPVNFSLGDNDLAIRVAPVNTPLQKVERSPIDLIMTQSWGDVRSMAVLPDSLIAVCSPGLLTAGPSIDTIDDLRHHTLIHNASRERAWAYWLGVMGYDFREFDRSITYGHFFMSIQAAIEGKGIAAVPSVLVESELKNGSLVALFGGKRALAGIYYLMCRRNSWGNPKIVSFREWLIREAKAVGWTREERAALKEHPNEFTTS